MFNKEAVKTLKREPLKVWEQDLFVREYTQAEKEDFVARVNTAVKDGKAEPVGLQIDTVIACTQEEDGSSVFTPDDKVLLKAASAEVISQVFTKVIELSGLDPTKKKES